MHRGQKFVFGSPTHEITAEKLTGIDKTIHRQGHIIYKKVHSCHFLLLCQSLAELRILVEFGMKDFLNTFLFARDSIAPLGF